MIPDIAPGETSCFPGPLYLMLGRSHRAHRSGNTVGAQYTSGKYTVGTAATRTTDSSCLVPRGSVCVRDRQTEGERGVHKGHFHPAAGIGCPLGVLPW